MSKIANAFRASKFFVNSAAPGLLPALASATIRLQNIFSKSQPGLIIIDDYFPNPATAFRVAEFNSIFSHFEDAVLYSTSRDRTSFSTYSNLYPQFASRVRTFNSLRHPQRSAAYLVFLNNISAHLPYLERHRLPFAFELYPGGGFYIDDPTSDAHLRSICESKYFRKVIVTQSLTRDYLLRKRFCREDQIQFIFGVVVLSDVLQNVPARRAHFGFGKETLDICFVANKYTERGVDKGYDRFIACAQILSERSSQVRFHVVGDFNESDIEIHGSLLGCIAFYGPRLTAFFPDFYAKMDLVLSPNIPFVFAAGSFDGFPTGCCIEAALCGTALFMCDELNLNEERFDDRRDVVIIPRDPEAIADIVEEYLREPLKLKTLAERGHQKVQNLFNIEIQMQSRLAVLRELFESS
jgi:glycosyltransferase involved in cell wall biosynthesis